jgi:hypothetical protein
MSYDTENAIDLQFQLDRFRATAASSASLSEGCPCRISKTVLS